MIKVSLMYPNSTDATFDIEHYCNTYIPMVDHLLGEALKGSNVDFGLARGRPGDSTPFIAMGHMMFDSVESFQSAFGLNAEKIMNDIPNYTNTQSQIQVSDIKL